MRATGAAPERTAAPPLPVEGLRRINFRFSGSGRHAACLTARGHRPLAPELWDLTGTRPRHRVLHPWDGESDWSVAVPTDDGNLLLTRVAAGGDHRLLLVVPAADGAVASIHELATVHDGGVRLVAGEAAGTAAVAFRTTLAGHTLVWRLSGRAELPEQVAELPGFFRGGVWLDRSGNLLALATSEGQGKRTVTLDLSDGTVRPLPGLAREEHLLLAAPRAGVLLTTQERAGAYRLGIRRRDDDAPTDFPDRLNAIEGAVTPLALDPSGTRLALSVTRGVRSTVLLYDLVEGGTQEIDPAGTLLPTARWSEGGLRLVHSAPDLPSRVVTLPAPLTTPVLADHGPTMWASARTRRFDGPGGPVEAVVYGDPAHAARVVVALHGGPEAAWQLTYNGLFQRLAAEGIAVVAPNQRGSTGYGAAHRDAIRGAWGGPDLADVLQLGRTLTAERGPGSSRLMLYGVSYGAYLALLAAAAEPHLWARTAAVAPFLSGRELYADGPAPVRTMLDRLGGHEEIVDDDLGPRDLLRLADRIRQPVLLVHGDQDPTIPVAHSRRLRDRLAAVGHPDAALTYLEIPGAGHDPLSGRDGHAVLERLVAFLRAESRFAVRDR
ncbi:prolyl oligopeptidase family serine peptidase [Microtetraspora sp. AC03309]|uniref:S9 family peptidase n=1 Tax=Microtetraspora sp. AC03309 TaxID=2779376 RepID=UPI001E5F001F|nr:prolyl oligopeptidase family serine peptidase [Microtetraspora sp. AC03309]